MTGESEQVPFTREDLVCLTETCTILKVLVEDQKKGFDKMDTRLEELSAAMHKQKDICEEKFQKILTEGSLPVKTMEQRMESIEDKVNALDKYKNFAIGAIIMFQTLIGLFAVFKDQIIIFFGGH
jgi:hypothetical protein